MVFAFVLILFGFYWIDKITTNRRNKRESRARVQSLGFEYWSLLFLLIFLLLFPLQLPIWYSDCNLCSPPTHTHTFVWLHIHTIGLHTYVCVCVSVGKLHCDSFPPSPQRTIEALCLNICNMLRVPGSWKPRNGSKMFWDQTAVGPWMVEGDFWGGFLTIVGAFVCVLLLLYNSTSIWDAVVTLFKVDYITRFLVFMIYDIW